MACCGQSDVASGNPQGAAARAALFNGADVPDQMVLVEYTGGNVGTTLWGGPGGTPSGRYYTFGASETDRIKHVDQRDVDWFLERRENKQTLFALYSEPATTAPDESEGIDGEPQTPPDPALGDAARDFATAGQTAPANDKPAKVDTDQSTDGQKEVMLAQTEEAPDSAGPGKHLAMVGPAPAIVDDQPVNVDSQPAQVEETPAPKKSKRH